jgi:hypothetical protein
VASEYVGDIKIIHLATKPETDGYQYCLICAKLLSVGSKTYQEGEEVFEERSTKSKTLARREYIRCSELQ